MGLPLSPDMRLIARYALSCEEDRENDWYVELFTGTVSENRHHHRKDPGPRTIDRETDGQYIWCDQPSYARTLV